MQNLPITVAYGAGQRQHCESWDNLSYRIRHCTHTHTNFTVTFKGNKFQHSKFKCNYLLSEAYNLAKTCIIGHLTRCFQFPMVLWSKRVMHLRAKNALLIQVLCLYLLSALLSSLPLQASSISMCAHYWLMTILITRKLVLDALCLNRASLRRHA